MIYNNQSVNILCIGELYGIINPICMDIVCSIEYDYEIDTTNIDIDLIYFNLDNQSNLYNTVLDFETQTGRFFRCGYGLMAETLSDNTYNRYHVNNINDINLINIIDDAHKLSINFRDSNFYLN
jgi:hypothetical protein